VKETIKFQSGFFCSKKGFYRAHQKFHDVKLVGNGMGTAKKRSLFSEKKLLCKCNPEGNCQNKTLGVKGEKRKHNTGIFSESRTQYFF
jgi:hypothetical protein